MKPYVITSMALITHSGKKVTAYSNRESYTDKAFGSNQG